MPTLARSKARRCEYWRVAGITSRSSLMNLRPTNLGRPSSLSRGAGAMMAVEAERCERHGPVNRHWMREEFGPRGAVRACAPRARSRTPVTPLKGSVCESSHRARFSTAPHRKPHHRTTHPHRHRLRTLTHLDAERKHCPRCHTDTRAPFPTDMSAPVQYGDGLKAYVVHLLVAQMLSLKRVDRPCTPSSRPRCCGSSPNSITPSPSGSTAPSSACSPLVAGQRQEPLDTRLLRRAHHPQTPSRPSASHGVVSLLGVLELRGVRCRAHLQTP